MASASTQTALSAANAPLDTTWITLALTASVRRAEFAFISH